MAYGISKKAGQSEEEELAHKLEHLLHKAKSGHGDGHAEEKAEDHGETEKNDAGGDTDHATH
jgi:hypothetical protein